ncbi:hypothetical protein SAMN02745165_00895 [Malonomonas rubra DSM 5091]|uniref:Uncharacterized protein n=1 Tax=Malonomonas rubra DSM 5091 TaxID=1122189 RepID=A0A1M6E1U4_MALRU|nr:hypothetical protein [Malonomonas rubra]SHI79238.1 hypothetical protein SAMN02745165_00895 [Malonomonas rubra DSM 5091]
MREAAKTKSELIIEQLMRELDPSSPRYQVLATARQFKSSWVELGEQLIKVKNQAEFQGWGYESFDDYCSREIRIRKETARKLTMAYRYLEQEEPELISAERRLQPLPDYRAIDLLRQAKEEQGFTEDEYSQLRESIIDQERSYPTVQKQFREVAHMHNPPEIDPLKEVRSILTTAKRLNSQLEELDDFPAEMMKELHLLMDELHQREQQLAEQRDVEAE